MTTQTAELVLTLNKILLESGDHEANSESGTASRVLTCPLGLRSLSPSVSEKTRRPDPSGAHGAGDRTAARRRAPLPSLADISRYIGWSTMYGDNRQPAAVPRPQGPIEGVGPL